VPIFWAVIPLVVALALIVMSMRYARKARPA
jgi:hypothetical protein